MSITGFTILAAALVLHYFHMGEKEIPSRWNKILLCCLWKRKEEFGLSRRNSEDDGLKTRRMSYSTFANLLDRLFLVLVVLMNTASVIVFVWLVMS